MQRVVPANPGHPMKLQVCMAGCGHGLPEAQSVTVSGSLAHPFLLIMQQGEGGGGYGIAAGGEGTEREGYEFGVDPNLDPELAMALRVSLEEERARQVATGGAPAAVPPAAGNQAQLNLVCSGPA